MHLSELPPCDLGEPKLRHQAWQVWLRHRRVIDRTLIGFRALTPGDREEVESDAVVAFVTGSAWRLHSIQSVAAWIRQIVANTAKTYMRRRRRVQTRELSTSFEEHVDAEAQTPAVRVERDELKGRVLRELERLHASLRDVAMARLVGRQDYAEIATRLGVTEATARKRMQLARRHLVKRLSDADSTTNSSRAG